jgi:hypothetical protein
MAAVLSRATRTMVKEDLNGDYEVSEIFTFFSLSIYNTKTKSQIITHSSSAYFFTDLNGLWNTSIYMQI